MSLIQFIPTFEHINTTAWKASSKGLGKRLVLGAPHTVAGDWVAGAATGRAEVTYIIERPVGPDVTAGRYLSVDRTLGPIGFQSAEDLRSLLETWRVKQSFSLAAVGDSAFDLRALAYVCGEAAGSVISGDDYAYGTEVARASLISPTWYVASSSSLTVSPGLATTSSEFVTLCRLAGIANAGTVTLMSDVVPPGNASALQGDALGAFALKVFINILNAAQGCSCATLHVEAFFCGLCSALTLYGHSDEGGLCREVLRECTYPKPVGVLAIGQAAYFGIPPVKPINKRDVRQVTLGLFLEMVGRFVCSDPMGAETSVFRRETDDAEGRPSEYPGLEHSFYGALRIMRERIADDYQFHPALVPDDSSHVEYFRADRRDRHYRNSTIAPFFWVEPGPLLTKTWDYQNVMVQGKMLELPLCADASVVPSRGHSEFRGRGAPGTGVYIVHNGYKTRRSGYQYLLSARYREANGLSRMDAVREPRLGSVTVGAMFVDEGVTNMARRRWTTPHNPTPHPLEGASPNTLVVSYRYHGATLEPALKDWQSGKVYSQTGPLYVKELADPLYEDRSPRHVGDDLLRWLDERGSHSPYHHTDPMGLPSQEVIRKGLSTRSNNEAQVASGVMPAPNLANDVLPYVERVHNPSVKASDPMPPNPKVTGASHASTERLTRLAPTHREQRAAMGELPTAPGPITTPQVVEPESNDRPGDPTNVPIDPNSGRRIRTEDAVVTEERLGD